MPDQSTIRFTKMQGAGNDFIVIDNRTHDFPVDDLIELAPRMCNRKFGVGADGLLALQSPAETGLDYTMLYRNADGSDAGMCGNGARCLALYAYTKGFGENLSFNIHENTYGAEIIDEQTVSIAFPMDVSVEELPLGNGHEPALYRIDAGTEHIVKEVSEKVLSHEEQLVTDGRRLRYNKQFQPKGTNVNFFCGMGQDKIKLQTYERGVEDLTLACGTGAIASAIGWYHKNNREDQKHETKAESPSLHEHVTEISTEGGILYVNFLYDPGVQAYTNIKLKGPAHFVFEGTFFS